MKDIVVCLKGNIPNEGLLKIFKIITFNECGHKIFENSKTSYDLAKTVFLNYVGFTTYKSD